MYISHIKIKGFRNFMDTDVEFATVSIEEL